MKKPGKSADNARFPERGIFYAELLNKSKVGQNNTTRSNASKEKWKSSQLNRVWKVNMFILMLVFSWFTGTVMCGNTLTKSVVLERDLEFTDNTILTVLT